MIDPEFKHKLDAIFRMRANYYKVYLVYATRTKLLNRSTIPLALMHNELADGRRYTLGVYIELRTNHVFSTSAVERKKDGSYRDRHDP
jgi:hypothetical protein